MLPNPSFVDPTERNRTEALAWAAQRFGHLSPTSTGDEPAVDDRRDPVSWWVPLVVQTLTDLCQPTLDVDATGLEIHPTRGVPVMS